MQRMSEKQLLNKYILFSIVEEARLKIKLRNVTIKNVEPSN